MMKNPLSKLAAGVLAVAAVLLFALPAAAAIKPVDPSDTLEVDLKTASNTVELHTYQLAEMEDLVGGEDICYSGIDNMPWTVKTVATGVYIEDLLDDVAQYTAMDVWNFAYLRFYATDGASCKFDYDDLFGERYYFAALHEEDGGLNADGEINYDIGEGESVRPMLSLSAEQQRLPSPSFEPSSPYEPECYTVLFGATEQEVKNVTSRVSDYKRGVYKLVIDMGNVSGPGGEAPVTGLTLDASSAVVNVGKTLPLTATISPGDATNQEVDWSSSNTAVATVSSSGVVTGVSVGRAVITATAAGNASITASCTVSVSAQNVAVTGITLSKSKLTLLVGDSKRLSANVLPSNASNPDVTWSSSDDSVAEVDENGEVTAVSAGTAKISAASEDGGYQDFCSVTVTESAVAVSGVSLNRSALTMARGGTFQLSPVFDPEDATNSEVYWSSSNPGVVTVDTDGLLTAVNIGAATISVMTDDGGYTAACQVTVSQQAAAFSDVAGIWAAESINAMVEMGWIHGYSDGTFRPSAKITRAEFLSILVSLLQSVNGQAPQSGNIFPDTNSHWAKEAISTAVALGIASGYPNGNFGPNDLITREQMAMMLTKAAGSSGQDGALKFTDAARISAWAKAYVSYAADKGWIGGYADGTFGPQKQATRAEVCALLWRFYQEIK